MTEIKLEILQIVDEPQWPIANDSFTFFSSFRG